MLKFIHRPWFLAAVMFALAACQMQPGQNSSTTTTRSVVVPVRISAGDYTASGGDILKVTIYNEPDLSGEFRVGPDGKIALPLVGAVYVAGQTLAMIPATIADVYRDGYLVDPKVSVELKGAH